MEKVPGGDMWTVIDSVTHRPALVNDVPQIDLDLDDADDLMGAPGELREMAEAKNASR
jgi:hypothetical protein